MPVRHERPGRRHPSPLLWPGEVLLLTFLAHCSDVKWGSHSAPYLSIKAGSYQLAGALTGAPSSSLPGGKAPGVSCFLRTFLGFLNFFLLQ